MHSKKATHRKKAAAAAMLTGLAAVVSLQACGSPESEARPQLQQSSSGTLAQRDAALARHVESLVRRP